MFEAGGPRHTSIKDFACASATRAALCTLDTWEHWCSELRRISDEEGELLRVAAGLHWPSCWDTEPLAFRLETAADPERLRQKGEHAVAAGVAEFFAKVQLAGPLQRQRAKAVAHFQTKLCATLLPHLHPQPNAEFYLEKLQRYGVGPVELGVVSRSLRLLRGSRPEVAWAVLLTWTGGWPTGRRMQDRKERSDGKHPDYCCGCHEAEDSLQHYVHCARLWLVLARVALPRPPIVPMRCALAPLGISRSDFAKLAARIAAALHTYRTLRFGRMFVSSFGRRAGEILTQVAQAAAHKFSCAVGERLGLRPVRGMRPAPSSL